MSGGYSGDAPSGPAVIPGTLPQVRSNTDEPSLAYVGGGLPFFGQR